MSKLNTELTATELAERLTEAATALPRALANLSDVQPGYPNHTPGSGPASGGGVPDGWTPLERLAINGDPAEKAMKRILKLVRDIHGPITELYSLSIAWGYDRKQGELDLSDTDHEGCMSCLRIGRFEQRSRYALYCRWCGDFISAEGRSPSVMLLQAYHDGKRITRAMVDADHPARKQKRQKRHPKVAA